MDFGAADGGAGASIPAAVTGDTLAVGATLATRAQDHYTRALQAQRDGNWALYGAEIERLGEILEELQENEN